MIVSPTCNPLITCTSDAVRIPDVYKRQAIIHGEKGQQVWTGHSHEQGFSLGVYKSCTEENLRYSQNAPLNKYDEVNTKCNLPAQIDIEATEGMELSLIHI